MSSGSFLKSVSTSTLDKLYDLPENIQDVMGLQALRPSAAVCKVMTVPDSVSGSLHPMNMCRRVFMKS